MKNLSTLLIICLILLVFALACASSREPQSGQPQNMNPNPPAPMPVEATRLTEEFRENPAAAAAKYDDQIVAVSGTISQVMAGSVILKGEASPVILQFPEYQKERIAALKPDTEAAFVCRVEAQTTAVTLADCVVK